MVTRFEKRAVAWMLTAMMCLSMVLSGSTVAYAKDDSPTDAAKEAAAESSGGTEESGGIEDIVPADAENPDSVEKDKEIQESKEGETEESKETKEREQTEENGKTEESGETETKEGEKAAEIFEDFEYQVLESGTVEVTKYNGVGGEVAIPDAIAGKTVSSIGESAFAYTNVSQVSIPASVTELQYYAFLGCYNLNKVILPENNKLEVIDRSAFGSTQITEINLPSIKKIGDNAFDSCSGLESVTLGNQLTTIGEWAFSYTGIRKIDIPDSVTSIEAGAFYFCDQLTEVNVGNQLAYIAESAFSNCGLKSFTIGDQVKKIGKYAFAGNSDLKEIDIPGSVTEIEYAAFKNCTVLGNVGIPDSLEKIGGFALDNTAWYQSQADGIVYAGNVLYDYKGEMPSGTVIEVKTGTHGIAGYAFDGDKNLGGIKISRTVTNIGDFAFHDCVSMDSVTIPESVTEIGEKALGYKTKDNAPSGRKVRAAGDNSVKMENFTIYGTEGSAAQTYAQENSFTFVAQTTTEKVPASPKIVPEVTDNTYVIGSSDGVTITCTGELKDFVNVMMDGVVVDKSNYTLREGSTILTFSTKYLDTLSVGKHTVTLNYTYGSVNTELTVLARGTGNGSVGGSGGAAGNGTTNRTNGSGSSVSPRTGDYAPVMLWILTAMFAAGIGVVVIVKRRSA